MSGSTSAGVPGQFSVQNGQMIAPDGSVYQARGIDITDTYMDSASQALATFPGLNFVRLSVFSYQPASAYQAFINTMTSHGVVVEIEDHISSDGLDMGGGRGGAFTGSELNDELNWYSSVASTYANNPYVWFGTDNEPPPDGLSTWQQETYNAIRNTGNNSPIMIELPGGGYPNGQTVSSYGMDPNVYAAMSNILVDVHSYSWSSDGSMDPQVVGSVLADMIHSGNSFPSLNGPVPVIIGEYGCSTEGVQTDANAQLVLQAAQQSTQTVGASAWTWAGGGADSLTDGQGNLTAYGQEVEQWIAANPHPPSATSAQVSPADVSASVGGGTPALINNAAGTGSAGSSYILPAAGHGLLIMPGDVLAGADTLDLRDALAATNWTGSAASLSSYLTLTPTQPGDMRPSGEVLSIFSTAGGTPAAIGVIPGATQLSLSTVLAHSIT